MSSTRYLTQRARRSKDRKGILSFGLADAKLIKKFKTAANRYHFFNIRDLKNSVAQYERQSNKMNLYKPHQSEKSDYLSLSHILAGNFPYPLHIFRIHDQLPRIAPEFVGAFIIFWPTGEDNHAVICLSSS